MKNQRTGHGEGVVGGGQGHWEKGARRREGLSKKIKLKVIPTWEFKQTGENGRERSSLKSNHSRPAKLSDEFRRGSERRVLER